MRNTVLPILFAGLLLTACNQPNTSSTSQSDSTAVTQTAKTKAISSRLLPGKKAGDPVSGFVPIDSANKMLLSYLNSINYQQNDSDLQSIIFDANTLRRMLLDPRITNVKVMFAHTLDYIHAGGKDINCGYQAKELTVVISGYDLNQNYVYSPEGMVLDIASPCPPGCPTKGTASSALLTPAATDNKK